MRVVIAMSGGVDSSVAAALLVAEGHEVIGVHMKLHDVEGGGPGHCCGLDDALDARRVASALDIPFYVLNLKQAFRKAVIDNLADTYLAGRTPNPCIHCNGVLKFRVLLQRALALGAEALATGHYARVQDGKLFASLDPAKDQSYFLFPMPRSSLQYARFPLGHMTKPQVRAEASRLGLLTADKPESQEICFIPDDDHARFIRSHRPDVDGSGEIVDEAGRVLGRHDGYYRYTIGQRRGLGVSLGFPAYVLRIEPDSCRVVVGPADRLWHRGLVATDANWLDDDLDCGELSVRIRHRGPLMPCQLSGSDPFHVLFDAPTQAVAPGQAAVIYRGDQVVGGGWITEALEATP